MEPITMMMRGTIPSADPIPTTSNSSAAHRVARITLSPKDWATIPDNPVQRNTEEHAKRATHLFKPSPTHAVVAMAILPDGRTFKLDGHTRSYQWERGVIDPPPVLYVDLYECGSVEEVEELYRHFDNKAAVETSRDVVYSAAKAAGIQFTSTFMKGGRFASAVRLLSGKMGKPYSAGDVDKTYEAIAFFKEELEHLDDLDPVRAKFPQGIIMGALAVFRRYDIAAQGFFALYNTGAGTKDGVHMDAVQALTEALAASSAKKKGSVADKQEDLFRRTLTAYEAYRAGEQYTVGRYGGVRPMDPNVIARHLSGRSLRIS